MNKKAGIIRKHVVRTMFSACLFWSGTVSGQTTSGTVTADETWSGTVDLTGDVYITSGTVTVRPGTEIRFARTNDNRVNGTYTQIYVIVHGDGAFVAAGTEAEPIVFTTADPTPEPGYYGGIDLEGLTDTTTVFRYCVFQYGNTAIDFRWGNGIYSGTTETAIEHCVFEYMTGTGIYITSGGIPHVSHCTFRNIDGPGIFSHAAASGDVSYCTFRQASRGVHLVGLSPWSQVIDIDHITVYNMDPRTGTGDKLGYGVSTSDNPAGTVTIRNSVFSTLLRACYNVAGGWDVTGDYNCFYDYADNFGPDGVEDGDPGIHTLQADPMMVDPDNDDFRLLPGSPCIGAADDGTNIGCVQDTATSTVRPVPDGGCVPSVLAVGGNPLVTALTVSGAGIAGATVYTMQGTEVARLSGNGVVRWDGTDAGGGETAAGIYVCRVRTADGLVPVTVLKR